MQTVLTTHAEELLRVALVRQPGRSPEEILEEALTQYLQHGAVTVRMSASLSREDLIVALTQWRQEKGIQVPQRYLRNRSTGQLRKMYDQVQAGSTYRLGRSWTER
jgi:hypothetical protein